VTAIPPEAITAVYETIRAHRLDHDDSDRTLTEAVLKAAAPHIAAAERERCARFVEQPRALRSGSWHAARIRQLKDAP
jgi:hypothetical protein